MGQLLSESLRLSTRPPQPHHDSHHVRALREASCMMCTKSSDGPKICSKSSIPFMASATHGSAAIASATPSDKQPTAVLPRAFAALVGGNGMIGSGAWYVSPTGGVLCMIGGDRKSSCSVPNASACSMVGSTSNPPTLRCLLFWNHTVIWRGVTLSLSASSFRVAQDGSLSSRYVAWSTARASAGIAHRFLTFFREAIGVGNRSETWIHRASRESPPGPPARWRASLSTRDHSKTW